MATSAFRSTTKRSCAPKSTSKPNPSTRPRRSRSLSRPSNSASQNGHVLDISLDDLADEFLRARAESDEESEAASSTTARSAGRVEGVGYSMGTESSRGREALRIDCGRNSVRGNAADFGKFRRRSVSVTRGENGVASRSNQIKPRSSDNTKLRQSSSQKPAKTSHGLRRTMSDKDFLLSQDNNSNHSSLTDDEAHDFRPSIYEAEKTISALKKAEHLIGDDGSIGLYEAMQKEFRHSVEDIRTELKKVIVKSEPAAIISGDDISPKSSEVLQAAIVKIRRNYNRKLEQSQKRKQDLLALLAAEEETGEELSKIVKEMQPYPENTATTERQTRSRKRSNDRMKMSKCLTEEAERYLEDFLSNVEDTDISSFDGERSDTTGSSLRERIQHHPDVENHEGASKSAPVPVDADGATLPWLQWENSSNLSIQCKPQSGSYRVSGNISSFALQEDDADSGNLHLERSQRIWKTEGNGISCGHTKESKVGVYSFIGKSRVCSFKMEDYSNLRQSEDFLFERLRHRTSIDSGSMILCERIWL